MDSRNGCEPMRDCVSFPSANIYENQDVKPINRVRTGNLRDNTASRFCLLPIGMAMRSYSSQEV